MTEQGFEFSTSNFEVAFGDHNLRDRLRYGSLGSNPPESVRDAVGRMIPSTARKWTVSSPETKLWSKPSWT